MPKLLDLFCKAGGASMGYWQAGFDIVGVDIEPQPNYPFEFVQYDVTKLKAKHIKKKFDAVAASPPCQSYSVTKSLHVNKHPELVEPTRNLLEQTGLPFVIENVPGAPLRNPYTLCGSMFSLRVRRHRLFETNFSIKRQLKCDHDWQNSLPTYYIQCNDRWTGTIPIYGKWNGIRKAYNKEVTLDQELFYASVAMGIDWMNWSELAQAIPPLYTFFMGKQMLKAMH